MHPSRLILLATALLAQSAVAQRPDAGAAQRITVDLSNFKFSPDRIILHHDQPYVLHLVNRAGGGHDFTARTFFESANVAPQDRSMVAHGEVEVPGGSEVDIHLAAPAPGQYELHCGHFLHSSFGMKGTIQVE
jgi:uncharacterized cupredoxin-like copper-binding protein